MAEVSSRHRGGSPRQTKFGRGYVNIMIDKKYKIAYF